MASNAAQANRSAKNWLATLTKTPAIPVVIIGIALFFVTGIFKPLSLNFNAVASIVFFTILLSIASAGQTMVLIGGGMDFSVGAVMSSSALIATYVMQGQDGHFIQVLIFSILMGAAVGFVNGVCSVKIGLPAMIVTMAISNVVTRLQYVLTQGTPSGAPGKLFRATVTTRFFGYIPSILLYAAVIFPIVYYLMNYSRFGKQVYLVGNNSTAASLCGVKVSRIQILTYVFSGMIAAFAGLLGVAYMGNARCQMFDNYAFDSLVAVIVGGTSFNGGIGSFTGTIAGAFLMTVISNSLTIFNFQQSVSYIINGIIMILLLVTYNRTKSVRQ